MVAFCPLPLAGSDGWPQAQEHIALTNRALGGPSTAWLEPLFNRSCHMDPAGSRLLPGNNCWPASRARMQHRARPEPEQFPGEGEAECQHFRLAPLWQLNRPRHPNPKGQAGPRICPCTTP